MVWIRFLRRVPSAFIARSKFSSRAVLRFELPPGPPAECGDFFFMLRTGVLAAREPAAGRKRKSTIRSARVLRIVAAPPANCCPGNPHGAILIPQYNR